MPKFIHEGHSTPEQEKEAEDNFNEYLGELKEEFERKGGIVVVNHDKPEDLYSFNITDGEIGDFIAKINASKKKN